MMSNKPKIDFSTPVATLPNLSGIAQQDCNGQLKVARVVPDYRMAMLLCGLSDDLKRSTG